MIMLKSNVKHHKLIMSVTTEKFQNIDMESVMRYLKIIDVSSQQDVEN